MADEIGNVLDGVDDATARIIIELQFDDSIRDQSGTTAASTETPSADCELARRLYALDLGEYREAKWSDNRRAEDDRSDSSDEDASSVIFTEDGERTIEGALGRAEFNCIICEDRCVVAECVCVPCEHYFCLECLNELFRTAMTSANAYPPRCCQTIVRFDDFKLLLDGDLAREFEARIEEREDREPMYCHHEACSTYIPKECRDDVTADCPTCGAHMCIFCKQARHSGDCRTDELTQQTLSLAVAEGWKQCPACHTMVELHRGCYHMTCHCSNEFCYRCGANYVDRQADCECPLFDVHNLVEDGQEVLDDEEGGGGDHDLLDGYELRLEIRARAQRERAAERRRRRAAEQARQHVECERHRFRSVTRGSMTCQSCDEVMQGFIFQCRDCQMRCCRRCRFTRT